MMQILATASALSMAIALAGLMFSAHDIKLELHAQTVALQTMAANSKPPVSIKLDGFSDEARASLSDALRVEPKARKPK